jgi:hypothetical protein
MRIARMLAESLAMQLATCPQSLCDDAAQEGMPPRLVAGLRAARDAFAEHVRETDAEELMRDITGEIRLAFK